RAADLAVEARRNGQTAWVWMFGHWPPYVPGTPGDPGVWRPLPGKVTPEAVTARLKPGDVLLHIGYTDIEVPVLTAAKEAGATTVAVVAGRTDGPPPASDLPTVWIDPHWTLGDADVAIDGYDCRLLPPSGAVGIAAWWMLTAEVAGREAR
ncbi:MAG: hypothetical protein HUU35_12005, partial [Armatimonadetes bacterium]|nr:hypothetical protein [Armatimonadota bacterium]